MVVTFPSVYMSVCRSRLNSLLVESNLSWLSQTGFRLLRKENGVGSMVIFTDGHVTGERGDDTMVGIKFERIWKLPEIIFGNFFLTDISELNDCKMN